MGHLHYHVRDVEANKRFWISLGGTPATIKGEEVIRFPDVFVVLTKAESSGGTEGSVVNHVAFRIQSLARLKAAGFDVQLLAQFPGVGSVHTPEGERIELFDETATNIMFTIDDGRTDRTADRHNHKITVPIIAHHIHLYLPEGSEAKAKAWYAKTFGAVPGMRWRYPAVDLPGINMNFSDNKQPMAPTRGRMLDHIGFEVRDLAAFCRKLAADGVKFDAPLKKDPSGVARARLTDPWGTSIELTEGFNQ
jgi:catechol 2,3-dioxygenase-like lactoylglutathione lyase family enzyme